MPIDIPTIQVSVSDVKYSVSKFNGGEATALNPAKPVDVPLPARIYPNVDSTSPLYGPGSARYEITGVTLTLIGQDPVSVAIDPKTFIDNYGIIHVGPSNMPKGNIGIYTIIFKATYSYIDPSTGNIESTELANLQIRPATANINTAQDRNTAIQYQQQPGING